MITDLIPFFISKKRDVLFYMLLAYKNVDLNKESTKNGTLFYVLNQIRN
jgi:hypothetical protein